MQIDEQELFNTISCFVKDLDQKLDTLNKKGIFFSPELYIAFGIGLNVMKNKKRIFKSSEVEWAREESLGNGGPTDIIFREPDKIKQTVIELKLRSSTSEYESDIEKLQSLDENKFSKYFCVLVDSFKDNKDPRLDNIEKEYKDRIKTIGQTSFKTNQERYSSQVHCILKLYMVK